VITAPATTPNVERGVVALRRRIFSGELAPGRPLPEVALAAELEVSRNTLREILLVLASQGLVRHAPNKSASVVQLGVRDARDIYLVRKLIETAAIERAATDPNPNLEPLSDALDRLQAATDARDLELLVETDLAFHRCLAAQLGSDRLSGLFHTIETQLRLAFSIVAFADREYEHPEPVVAEHRQLYDLVRRGHVDRAKQALLEHLTKYESRLVAVLVEHESRQDQSAERSGRP
jgi:DNA-binding GntR family transcriptional regulator